MNVFVLCNPESDVGKRLRRVIEETHLKSPVEYHETLAGLLSTLTRPGKVWAVGVFQVVDREELYGLVSAGECLKHLDNILILPDRRPDVIAKGHLLYPRFIAFADGELAHVGTVLESLEKKRSNRFL